MTAYEITRGLCVAFESILSNTSDTVTAIFQALNPHGNFGFQRRLASVPVDLRSASYTDLLYVGIVLHYCYFKNNKLSSIFVISSYTLYGYF